MFKTKNNLLFLVALLAVLWTQGQNAAAPRILPLPPPDSLFYHQVYILIREPDVQKKEAMYRELLKEFPEGNSSFRIEQYKYARTSLALFWSSKRNPAKVMEYYKQIKKGLSPGMAVAFASNLTGTGNYSEAIKILNDVMKPISDETNNAGSLYTYLQAYDFYAEALFHLSKKKEALVYIQKAYNKSDCKNTEVNVTYVKILHSLGHYRDALPIMEDLVRDGMATDDVKEVYRDSYSRVQGCTREEFNNHMASLENELREKMQKEADDKLVTETTYSFSLRDMNGNTVSLSNMKGKIVVLDFWATWCGPCRRSMPAMQTLVSQYKNDPNVKFFFIDTGEKTPGFEEEVRKILKDNSYDFYVLYDPRSPQTGKCAVATGYKITGIPTKLVIDGNGRLRYRIIGFNGGNDATVAELTAMIEKVK